MKSISHGHLKDTSFRRKMLIAHLVSQEHYTLCCLPFTFQNRGFTSLIRGLMSDRIAFTNLYFALLPHLQLFLILSFSLNSAYNAVCLQHCTVVPSLGWLCGTVIRRWFLLPVSCTLGGGGKWSAAAFGTGSDARSDKRWKRCVITFAF